MAHHAPGIAWHHAVPRPRSPIPTPFGFTGELADANGLLYLRARHYAPRLGA